MSVAVGVGVGPTLAPVKGGGVLDLDAYLASLSGGFRFNVRKTDRYFQESAGPTLADDVGETIGLALSQRLWGGKTLGALVASQPELATSWLNGGSFPFDTFSQSGTGFVGSTSTAKIGGAAASPIAVTTADLYQVTIQVNSASKTHGFGLSSNASGAGSGRSNALTIPLTASPVTVVGYITPTADGSFYPQINNQGAFASSVDIASVSIKKVIGNHALQTGASTLRPIRQAEGAKFDASDDNWLMSYLAASGANFIQTRTAVPASLPATQVIAGASGSGANRELLGVNTSGFACAGIGSDSTSTIVGTTDLRGSEADIAVTHDGSTVRLIVNGFVEYEAAQNGGPTTAIPFRIGALNNNGTAGSFYGGAIKDIVAGTDYLTLARFNQIRAAMAANQ